MRLCGGATGGSGNVGRRPLTNTCRGQWPRRAGSALAGIQSGLLSESVFAGTSGRSATGAAEQVLGCGACGPASNGREKAQPAGAGTCAGGSGQKAAPEKAAVARIQAACADGSGEHGRERDVRLADGGRGEAPRPGACAPQGLRVRWTAIQLDAL